MIRQLINWTGVAAMVAAPYFIDSDIGKHLLIFGFVCLTVQSIHIKAHNLTVLNLLGILGYTIALLK